MGQYELEPPPIPMPTGNKEVDKHNIMLYEKNREIYTRATGKVAPRPSIQEPPAPNRTGDPELDQLNQALYLSWCEYYKGLTGHYPQGFAPPMFFANG